MNRIKKLLLPLYKRYRFYNYFIKDSTKLPLMKRIWCLNKGFFPKNYVLYNFPNTNYKNYISDYQEYAKMDVINVETSYINNKIVFTELMNSYLEMPKILGLLVSGKWLQYKRSSIENIEELFNFIIKNDGVIMKPISGDGGIGIFKISAVGEEFLCNQERISEIEIKQLLSKLNGYYVSKLVTQHDYSNTIYSKSVNTIRLLTMIDIETKEPFIAAASHRIGNDRSYPVDNCAKGGFTAEIDIDTGILRSAVRTYFRGKTPNFYDIHPDSKAMIKGHKIPNWDYIKTKTLELANAFQFIPYLAWDIVVLPNENITLLEANDGADLKLHQVHTPLLQNEKVKRFYSHYKAI